MTSYFIRSPAESNEFSDESIDRLVRTFYGEVRGDILIGPVFERRINDWEPHLERMIAFWKTVLRGEAAYSPGPKGPPPTVHQGISELTMLHFERWLSLFARVAHDVFEPAAAEFVVSRSQRMARALSAHLKPSNAA